MNNWVKGIIIFLLSGQILAADEQTFGSGADMSKLRPISTILTSPEKYITEDVTVKGAIVSVCEKSGCWMKLASDKKFQTLRIKVRDGDMVFPIAAKGKTAFATGKLVANKMNKEKAIAYLDHMAKEANEDFDPGSVNDEGMTIYQLTPTGVTITE